MKIKFRPPQITTTEYYYNEIVGYNDTLNSLKITFIDSEKSRNYFTCLVFCLISAFISIILIEYLTFSYIINIFSLQESGTANRNSLLISLLLNLLYYFIIFSVIYFYYDNYQYSLIHGDFSNIKFTSEIVILFIIFPLFLSGLLFRLANYIFFYAHSIENLVKTKTNTFFFKNFISYINYAVFTENGMAYLYLFRIYNIVISVIFSLILLFYYNKYSFIFSSEDLLSFVVYQNKNTDQIKYFNFILCLQIIYLTVNLSYFYHYPQFSKIKQIFDSLFMLYDQKIIDTLENETTNEKEALKSNFAKLLINFDHQSELFYRYRNVNVEFGGLSEVIIY